MILACPSCGARFLVDEGEIGPDGRKVRCGRCGRSWRARPGGAKKPRRRRWALWTAAFLATAAVGAGAAFDRDRAAAAWRGAVALYAELAAWVDPPGAGLELRIVSSERTTENGREVFRVAGRIRNPGQYPRAVPGLRVGLRDAGGRTLQARDFPAPVDRLTPHATADFALEIDRPAPGAARISVSFHETTDEAR